MPAVVQTMPSNPGPMDSTTPSTDKKRNKLGYHRTSVACGRLILFVILSLPANEQSTAAVAKSDVSLPPTMPKVAAKTVSGCAKNASSSPLTSSLRWKRNLDLHRDSIRRPQIIPRLRRRLRSSAVLSSSNSNSNSNQKHSSTNRCQ